MTNAVSKTLLKEASVLLQESSLDAAADLLSPLSESPPPDAPAGARPADFWRDAAGALRDAGMTDASLAAVERARQAGLAPHVATIQAGLSLLAGGRFAEAREALEPEAGGRPENAVLRNLLALALFECGEHGPALEEWRATQVFSGQKLCPISIHPLSLSLGAMALERFRLEHAPSALSKVEEDAPAAAGRAPGRTRRARRARIEKALDQGRPQEALGWMDAEEGEDNGLLRAIALTELERWDEARQGLARSLSGEGAGDLQLESLYGYCLVEAGEPELGLRVLESVAPAGPDDFLANYFLGAAHLALGDRPRSLASFRRGFTDYFFDTFHSVFVPTWQRVRDRAAKKE